MAGFAGSSDQPPRNSRPPRDSRPARRSRFGLTLVEMLIAVSLMLILVFALVRVFQSLGDTVRDSKSMMELMGQLRTFTQQLQEDLDHCTIGMAAITDSDSAQGYREIIEGMGTDRDVDGDRKNTVADGESIDDALTGTLADAQNLADVDYHAVLDAQGNPVRNPKTNVPKFAMTAKGDRDDILMMTIRSAGKPFVGQVRGMDFDPSTGFWRYTSNNATIRIIESQEAEVVWWSECDDRGVFRIFRRLLLVRPDMRIQTPELQAPQDVAYMTRFVRDNDLSVRFRSVDPNNPSSPAVVYANTMADLALRENRYAHSGQFNEGPSAFPFPVVLSRVRANLVNFNNIQNPTLVSGIAPNRVTEFLALADTLAFDVKVFDPTAPIDLNPENDGQNVSGPALVPSDPSFSLNPNTLANVNGPPVPRGAFVDLNYREGTPMQPNYTNPTNGDQPISEFSNRAHNNSGLALSNKWPWMRGVHDTWPRNYERDGLWQSKGVWKPYNPASNPPPPVPLDAGTNGLDDLDPVTGKYLNGVDDATEMETAPPYAADLRGIEITVRVLEFNTRQVRQARVVGDFTRSFGS